MTHDTSIVCMCACVCVSACISLSLSLSLCVCVGGRAVSVSVNLGRRRERLRVLATEGGAATLRDNVVSVFGAKQAQQLMPVRTTLDDGDPTTYVVDRPCS
jgi:hypothetical protein